MHSLMADRSMVVGHVPMDHTCSFMCTSHIEMTAHIPAFLWVGEHYGNLLYAHMTYVMAEHTRCQSHPLAATSMSQMVTHPSTNQAQSHLTSVIRLWIVTPCQWGSSWHEHGYFIHSCCTQGKVWYMLLLLQALTYIIFILIVHGHFDIIWYLDFFNVSVLRFLCMMKLWLDFTILYLILIILIFSKAWKPW